jgi:arsenate reductase
MAEAFINKYAPDKFQAQSAGIEPGKLNPTIVKVMQEIDIDISNNQTNSIDEFIKSKQEFDYIITVCDEGNAARCPIFPGKAAKKLHWTFDDPSSFKGTEEKKLKFSRKIRDQIKEKTLNFLSNLK